MVIGIFGESCTGKSTLAEKIATSFPCEVFTGKDYLRLAKNENIAKVMFQKKLTAAVSGENIIYVISEKEHLSLLPEIHRKISLLFLYQSQYPQPFSFG